MEVAASVVAWAGAGGPVTSPEPAMVGAAGFGAKLVAYAGAGGCRPGWRRMEVHGRRCGLGIDVGQEGPEIGEVRLGWH